MEVSDGSNILRRRLPAGAERRRLTEAGEVGGRNATPADLRRIADAMASAFVDDPITVGDVPDEARRMDVMRDFFMGLLENVFMRFGLVQTNVEGGATVAKWTAPRPVLEEQEEWRPVPGLPAEWCSTCNRPGASGRVPSNGTVPPAASA